MTYKFPIGIAYKKLDVLDGADQEVRVMVEADDDGDNI